MIGKFLLTFLFLVSIFPPQLFAEESGDNVLEAMCRQVLSPEFSLSPKVLMGAAKEKVVELPRQILDKATDALSKAPEALVETLESMKVSSSPTITESLAKKFAPPPSNGVSGEQVPRPDSGQAENNFENSTLLASVYNSGLDLGIILIKNWPWTLGGLALLYLFFKFS